MSDFLKLLLVETTDTNLGDSVLADCDHYLLRKVLAKRDYRIFRYGITTRDIDQIKFVDAIVFSGSIFKSYSETHWLQVTEVLQEADRCGVPVFFSGIGSEDFDPADQRVQELKRALNLPCVKGFSCCDDIALLKRAYIDNPKARIKAVYDSAVWCNEVYAEALKRCERPEDPTVGLGIVRHGLFADYGHPTVTREQQLAFWTDVVRLLEERGLSWKLFTNGDNDDEAFADEVLEAIGHGEKLPAPLDGEDLVCRISQFCGVIAGRMHTNIIAHSLGITSVGFVWNKKLGLWGEKIGHSERFFEPETMTAETVVARLAKAMNERNRLPQRKKRQTYRELRWFIRTYGTVRPDRATIPSLADRDMGRTLVAPQLGGIDRRFKGTNSQTAFRDAVLQGFRIFGVDVRLTKDRVPVCVDRWHSDTYALWNLPIPKKGPLPALPSSTFEKQLYYHRFPTITLSAFAVDAAPRLRKRTIAVIVAFGRPSDRNLTYLLDQLGQIIEANRLDQRQILVRLERRSDVALLRESGLDIDVVYHVVPPKSSSQDEREAFLRDELAFCVSEGIEYVAFADAQFTDMAARVAREFPIRPVVYSPIKTSRIIELLQMGADLVGSHYYEPAYLHDLIR